MKSSKILSFVILATALSGFSQAGAQTINETRTGYVTAVETVWTQRIINEPVTTTSCHTNQAHQGFHVYLLTLLCFIGFAMESLAVGNCGSPALDLGSRKPDGWVEVRVRNFVYAWRQSKSCPLHPTFEKNAHNNPPTCRFFRVWFFCYFGQAKCWSNIRFIGGSVPVIILKNIEIRLQDH